MAINDGQRVRAQESNEAWVSKKATTGNEVTGIIDLNNTTDVNSGAQIPNLQEKVNDNDDRITANEADIADVRTTQGTIDGDIDMGAYTAGSNGYNVTDDQSVKENIQDLIDGVDARQLLSEKGVANGYASLDGSGLVPSAQLPSFVDDVIEVADFASLPVTGETGKIYVTLDDNKTYRWSGSIYVEISPNDVNSVNGETGTVVLDTDDINEGATNLYYTDTRADARIAAASIDDLADVDTTTVAPNVDEALVWDGSNWVPGEAVGGGGGSGLTNFIPVSDSTFEVDVIGDTNWGEFDDGSVSVPVDGDGGTAANISFDLTTTLGEVQEGAKSFKVSKSAADAQGEGVRLNLQDIELAFQGGIAYGSFYYDTSSANYNETWGVWLYDRDGTALINILEANNFIPKGKGKFEFSFLVPDNAPNVSQLRLILMETDTNTDAYDLIFDVFATGPDTLSANVSFITAWSEYTPSTDPLRFRGFGTPSNIRFLYRESGDSIEFVGEFQTGTCTADNARIPLPDGFTGRSDINGFIIGNYIRGENVTDKGGFIKASADNSYVQFTSALTFGGASVDPTLIANGNSIVNNNTFLLIKFTLPINELKNNTFTGAVRNSQLSIVNVSQSAGQSIANNSATVIEYVVDRDTRSLWNTSTHRFIADKPMTVDIMASLSFTGNATGVRELSVRKNGAVVRAKTDPASNASSGISIPVNATIDLDKDDYIDFTAFQNSGGSLTIFSSDDYNFVSITEKAFTQTAIVQQNKIAVISDVKANGVSGGTFTSGAWQTRDLNTLDDRYGLIKSLSSNQFELGPGVYDIEAYAMSFDVDTNKAKLRNITDSTDDIIGMSHYASPSSSDNNIPSVVLGTISISSTKTFEIQHRCSTTKATNGFGIASSQGVDEIFTQVKITKVGE